MPVPLRARWHLGLALLGSKRALISIVGWEEGAAEAVAAIQRATRVNFIMFGSWVQERRLERYQRGMNITTKAKKACVVEMSARITSFLYLFVKITSVSSDMALSKHLKLTL
jgi:hypothetical protein